MNKKYSLIILIHFILIGLFSQSNSEKSLLIIIDMQEEFTVHSMDSIRAVNLIKNVNEAITIARPMEVIFVKANIKVLSISFKGIKVQLSEHIDLDGRLYRKKNDKVLAKDKSSAFSVSELTDYIENEGIQKIYLAGLMLGECVTSTAIDGLSRGYNICVINECVAAKKEVKTGKLLEELSDKGVELISLKEFDQLMRSY